MTSRPRRARIASRRSPDRRLAALLPAALALFLAIPAFPIEYLYDDYDFFGRVQTLEARDLLPDPRTLFYRPVSRELYFAALYALDGTRPFWGHAGNAILWGAGVALLAALATRLAGPAAGFWSGILFAGLGAAPTLVGWVSCSGDLLAIALVLAALHLQLSGRTAWALLAAALALLSKETAVAFLPALALIRPVADAKPLRVRLGAASFAALAGAWAAVHPGIRHLLAGGFESSETGVAYLSVSGADRLGSLARSAATLVNVPLKGSNAVWMEPLLPILAAAAVGVAGSAWLFFRRGEDPAAPRARAPKIALMAGLLTFPPVLLISMVVRGWQPYYVVLAALGSSLLGGWALARLPRLLAVAAAVGFLGLGMLYRGMDLGSTVPTERTMGPPSERLARVREGLRAVVPRLDGPTQLMVSIHTPEYRDVPIHLIRLQAPRVWYRNPELEVIHPQRRRASPAAERLTWVSPDLTVHAIDPRTLEVRSSGPRPDPDGRSRTLRAYAQGLASSGGVDRAVAILLGMEEPDEWDRTYNRRLAAALFLAEGRSAAADSLLQDAPRFRREDAIAVACELLARPAGRDLDRPVLEAVGVPPEDPEAMRSMMRWFALNRYPKATVRFARRLLALRPGDSEAAAVLRMLGPAAERLTTPVEYDELW